MDSFPGSWPLVRKHLPSLLGAGLGAIASNFAAGRSAYLQVRKDARSKFPTWTERSRRMPIRMPYRRRSMRKTRKPMRRAPSKRTTEYKSLVRTTGVTPITISASATSFSVLQPTLSQVYLTDLTTAYRLYRLKKVVLVLAPKVDSGNSGTVNNLIPMIATACDPEDLTTPANIGNITAYDNSYQKFLTSGDVFRYSFYPKVVNAVGNAGAAAYVSSYGANPWMFLNAAGTVIPHQSLKLGIQFDAATTITYNYYFEYHFDVKGLA